MAQLMNIAVKLVQDGLAFEHHVLIALLKAKLGRAGLLLQSCVFFLQHGAGVFSEACPKIGTARSLFIVRHNHGTLLTKVLLEIVKTSVSDWRWIVKLHTHGHSL